MGLTPEDAKADLIERAIGTAGPTGPTGLIGPSEPTDLGAFLRQYYRRVAARDLIGRDVVDIRGAALAHRRLGARRAVGAPLVRVYNPEFDQHGWQSRHTVVDIVTDDLPFLVDSMTMELNRHSLGIHLVVHPQLQVRRDADGRLVDVLETGRPSGSPGEGVAAVVAESFIHVEVDRQTEPDFLAELEADLLRVLGDVRRANEDWRAMRSVMLDTSAGLDAVPTDVDDDIDEARALLEWLADDHFTFLGYREYRLVTEDGEDALTTVPASGLGILRDTTDRPRSRSFTKLPPEVRRKARERRVLTLTKANSRSTLHRPSYLDYVGIKQFDEAGEVVGERRFLGLFTSSVYNTSATNIPVVVRKVHSVIERAAFPPGSHDEKELLQIIETYPRDELFQVTADELFAVSMGVLELQERRLVRLFARRDAFGRFVSCLVFIPRDRYTTETRLAVQDILRDAFRGTSLDYTARVSESVLARFHVIVHTEPGDIAEPDLAALEARLVEVTRSWSDGLQNALTELLGEEEGIRQQHRYGEAFPAGYREVFPPRVAVADIERLEALEPVDGISVHLYTDHDSHGAERRLKLFRSGGPLSLSDVLPHLQSMGVTVIDERPFEISVADGPPVWIYDFGLRCAAEVSFDARRVRDAFQETFLRVWHGEVESDGFNRLVLGGGIHWRDIAMLRGYSRYLRQTSSTFSLAYIESTLAENPYITGLLVQLFHARFGPSWAAAGDSRDEAEERMAKSVVAALDEVVSLDEDRILRSFLTLIRATLRTNYYQHGPGGEPRPYLTLKLDPGLIPDLPLPRPAYELFVYSPRVEGVHLRAGRVARGGIRWSDRREDFRTEVLGLMKAQAVKNAVIVPVGAKGGFVVKQPPAGGDRSALMDEVVACYRTFISGMLELTDNIVGGEVVAPPDVVRHDGDDPYLVVAADKGTASFSDMANAIAIEQGFWLGDAFASGGSAGYDHKEMGITARGAWESVTRHFRNLGVDIATTDFSVAGIGDMSGDVFGNGMLLSHHIRLVAAFDHRHVFLDPTPDPERSHAERERLFRTPGSTWADYDPTLLSAGGGVFPRTAKSVPLSPEVRAVLGVDATALAPADLIRAVLRAPVDLLWNGGVGTYVKATLETNLDVGDKANDSLRVDAAALRCRVVGEGGNLGFTQRARIEYAQNGGRINTDAIDNSAGVDCSDHEVNIKILLDAIVRAGDLTGKQRNALLAEMTEEVADLVLRDNEDQSQALDIAGAQSAAMVGVHTRYIRSLEQAGKLDRAVEFLPSDDELTARRAAGTGLTAPEFAVLLAYTKSSLAAELLDSDVPEDPYLHRELVRSFPTPLRERFRAQMEQHRLRREIVSTVVANRTVNLAGTTFVFRLADETSASMADIIRAHRAAHEVFAMDALWANIAELDNRVPTAVQTGMLLEARKLTERASRWLIHHRRSPLDIAATVEVFAGGVAVLADQLPELVVGPALTRVEEAAGELIATGVPIPLAGRVAGFGELFSALDIVEVARGSEGDGVETVAPIYFGLGDALHLDWVRDHVVALPRESRWQSLARASIREDLYRWHAALTADVLALAPEGSGDERIARWLESNEAAVARYQRVLSDVTSGGSADLAALSVVVRDLRALISIAGTPD